MKIRAISFILSEREMRAGKWRAVPSMHLGTKKTALVVPGPSLLPVRVPPQRLRKQAAVDLSSGTVWGLGCDMARFPAEKGVLFNMQLFAALFDEFGLTVHKPPALGVGNHWPR